MKGYLNRQERENLIAMVGFGEWLEKRTKNMKNKEALKWIRTAKTFLQKAADELAMEVGENQKRTILRQARDYTLEMNPNVSLSKLKKTDIYYLASIAREKCLVCTEKNHENCDLRQVLKRLDIQGEGHGKCEYDEFGVI